MRLTMRPEDLKEQFGFEFSLKKWNFRLTAEVLLLSGVGVTVVGAIAPQYELRQAGGVVLGAALMCAFALWDYRRLAGMGWLLYLGGMGLLLAVNLMGAISGGAARWLDVGPLRFQPSELWESCCLSCFSPSFQSRTGKSWTGRDSYLWCWR